MQILLWAIIATGSAAGIGFFLIKQMQRTARIKEEYRQRERDYKTSIEQLTEDVRKRNEIIKAMEDINRETAKKKRDMRKSDNPAQSATDIMRKLAADDSRGDDTSAGD